MSGRVALLLLLLPLLGCSGGRLEDFRGSQPKLVLEDYFVGKTRGWGLFVDRFGAVKRQFVVDIDGSWDGRILVLDEHFRYPDGSTDGRKWTIRKLADGAYEGTAADVDGAALGRSEGQALQWSYHLMLKVDDGTWRVHMDDWMYLQPDGVLINRTTMTKLGVELGTLSLFFAKAR
jgi:hypothetical protein